MDRLVNWIEIPAADFERACGFYGSLLDAPLQRMPLGDAWYGLFPTKDRANAGAVVASAHHQPGTHGVTIYLDGGGDLDRVLRRVEPLGGRVVLQKTWLGEEAGFVGLFMDPEGNRIGVHSTL